MQTCHANAVDLLICINHFLHSLPGSCSTFLVLAPKKISTKLKMVPGASTKWCAWCMAQSNGSEFHLERIHEYTRFGYVAFPKFWDFFALRVVEKVSRFEETPNFADMEYWNWQRGSKSREFRDIIPEIFTLWGFLSALDKLCKCMFKIPITAHVEFNGI